MIMLIKIILELKKIDRRNINANTIKKDFFKLKSK